MDKATIELAAARAEEALLSFREVVRTRGATPYPEAFNMVEVVLVQAHEEVRALVIALGPDGCPCYKHRHDGAILSRCGCRECDWEYDDDDDGTAVCVTCRRRLTPARWRDA